MRIRLNDIDKSFGEKQVLSRLSLSIDEPGVYAICGPSGCGKTTLLRIIAGFERPDGGVCEGFTSADVSYVFQEPRLLSHATVLQNLLCVLPRSHDSAAVAMQWLCAVGLSEVANERPDALSGGMQTRLSFARALAAARPILLLDEPFNGLDEAMRARMAALLRTHAKDKIVLLVSHHAEDLELLGARVLYTFPQ
jgi:ABC-type nitrate/sulfonate/bicarbonate transport system ATPase subunit